MLKGSGPLRRAESVLKQQDFGRDAVREAAELIWSAMYDADEWPEELQEQCIELQKHLFAYGVISKTVERMNQDEVLKLRAALLEFLDAARKCDGY